jgi:pimeloyl-[acyl-carrier protein] synthase
MTTMARDDELAKVSKDLAAYFEDPSKFRDPFPTYKRLRELEPVHWNEQWATWMITGYQEAEEVLHHENIGREGSAQRQFRYLGVPGVDTPEVVRAVDIVLAGVIHRDPPEHTRLRKLVAQAFTPRAIAKWTPRIEELADGLVERAARKDSFDFLHEVAMPLPQTVICALLGVPLEDLVKPQGTNHTQIMTVRGSEKVAPPPADIRAITQERMVRDAEYWRGVIAERRQNPRPDDIVTMLAQAEEDGERLTMDELIGTVNLIIGAGHETTANLVTNGMLALLQNRDQFELLQREPSLMQNAIDEVLRYATPARGQSRIAMGRIEVGGKVIEEGQMVQVLLLAANRDPRMFADPERFDITRENARQNIAFTAGIHFCLGAALARLEATAMFKAICRRLGDIELASDDLQWRSTFVRALESLPVRRRRH